VSALVRRRPDEVRVRRRERVAQRVWRREEILDDASAVPTDAPGASQRYGRERFAGRALRAEWRARVRVAQIASERTVARLAALAEAPRAAARGCCGAQPRGFSVARGELPRGSILPPPQTVGTYLAIDGHPFFQPEGVALQQHALLRVENGARSGHVPTDVCLEGLAGRRLSWAAKKQQHVSSILTRLAETELCFPGVRIAGRASIEELRLWMRPSNPEEHRSIPVVGEIESERSVSRVVAERSGRIR